MKIYNSSLSRTLDSVNEAFFFKQKTSASEREEIALWIAGRQGKLNSYANMFAPTVSDMKNGIRLFTGETVRSGASLRHVTGEEACRALILLNSRSKRVKEALKEATAGIGSRLEFAKTRNKGLFCCGTCDPALWRHITAGGLPGMEGWIKSGLKVLRANRDKAGRWRRFPFFYTLLALTEIDLPEARAEMKYAAKECEKYLARSKPSQPTIVRRTALLERVLAGC